MTEHIPCKQYVAKIIRIITVPPVMVLLLLTLLFTVRSDIFSGTGPFALSIVFLAGIPILAYPLSILIPSVREKGRDGQRKLTQPSTRLQPQSGVALPYSKSGRYHYVSDHCS